MEIKEHNQLSYLGPGAGLVQELYQNSKKGPELLL